jgi:hypothetical protein
MEFRSGSRDWKWWHAVMAASLALFIDSVALKSVGGAAVALGIFAVGVGEWINRLPPAGRAPASGSGYFRANDPDGLMCMGTGVVAVLIGLVALLA